MKKLFIVMVAMCLSFPLFARVSDATMVEKEKSTQEIQIEEAAIPGDVVRPRMAMPYTRAWIDYDMGYIEVEICRPVGVLTIAVTDMAGYSIYNVTIDSEMTPYVTIPMPDSGVYRLTISGDEYLGEGNFMIG
ncbi:hypothetical protein [uncultured Alistipes sp.]|jgi:hypothetical protein|uniref:hypothetical protein n=1 Tax=Alistipes sp. TaxID=1872444 RepID=UPI0025CC93B3|nr:hypothetical protein [uncultured Alistipes sp.]